MKRKMIPLVLLLGSGLAWGDPQERTKHALRSGADAVVDGAFTVGRTVRDFFRGGYHAARETWRSNANKTRHDVQKNDERMHEEDH
jgi:hypothetical protein